MTPSRRRRDCPAELLDRERQPLSSRADWALEDLARDVARLEAEGQLQLDRLPVVLVSVFACGIAIGLAFSDGPMWAITALVACSALLLHLPRDRATPSTDTLTGPRA